MARSGEEALKRLLVEEFALILLDLHMPGMDGYAALTALRERATPADLPVLVLTAVATRTATHRALELGANAASATALSARAIVLWVMDPP